MTPDIKLKIVDAAIAYLEEKQITQSDLSTITRINPAYLSNMLKGKFVFENKDVITEIAPKWFQLLAEGIGYTWDKQYWEMVLTAQAKEVLYSLDTFRRTRRSGAIICPSGMGKTYIIDRFVTKHPGNTIRVTVSNMHRLKDIIKEIAEKLGLPFTAERDVLRSGQTLGVLKKIIHEFRWMHRRGEQPILILDEAENLNGWCFGMIKALYDGIAEYCPIILIGTDELEDKMLRMKLKKKPGMPQFYRRFSAGFRRVTPKLEFQLFYDKYKIEKPLQKLLNELCENYGELHDYLEPVLREADERKKPLTEDLFRIYHNMPKF